MGLQQTLKALADPTRREILNLLKSGKKAPGKSQTISISPPPPSPGTCPSSRTRTWFMTAGRENSSITR